MSRDFLFDNRLTQRNINQNRITREEVEQFLATLPDLEDMCDDIGEEIYGKEHKSAAVSADFSDSNEDDEV